MITSTQIIFATTFLLFSLLTMFLSSISTNKIVIKFSKLIWPYGFLVTLWWLAFRFIQETPNLLVDLIYLIFIIFSLLDIFMKPKLVKTVVKKISYFNYRGMKRIKLITTNGHFRLINSDNNFLKIMNELNKHKKNHTQITIVATPIFSRLIDIKVGKADWASNQKLNYEVSGEIKSFLSSLLIIFILFSVIVINDYKNGKIADGNLGEAITVLGFILSIFLLSGIMLIIRDWLSYKKN